MIERRRAMVGNGGAEGAAESFESLLGGLRDEFIASIRTRAESVNWLAAELRQTEAPSAILTRLAREAHTLKGSAGTFGFPEIGEAAAEVERAARDGNSSTRLTDIDAAVTFLFETIRLTAEGSGGVRADS